jgi:hypothetical protein
MPLFVCFALTPKVENIFTTPRSLDPNTQQMTASFRIRWIKYRNGQKML